MAQTVKNLPTMQETWVRSLCWEDPLEEGWQPTPVFLPGESHGQRKPGGFRPICGEGRLGRPSLTRQRGIWYTVALAMVMFCLASDMIIGWFCLYHDPAWSEWPWGSARWLGLSKRTPSPSCGCWPPKSTTGAQPAAAASA